MTAFHHEDRAEANLRRARSARASFSITLRALCVFIGANRPTRIGNSHAACLQTDAVSAARGPTGRLDRRDTQRPAVYAAAPRWSACTDRVEPSDRDRRAVRERPRRSRRLVDPRRAGAALRSGPRGCGAGPRRLAPRADAADPGRHRYEVVPDWVCEVLSPSTASKDREIKMPIYAHYGVAYAWLVDPKQRSLEAYALDDGEWRLLSEASSNDTIAVAPFDALQLDLISLWT